MGPCDREYPGVGRLAAVVTTDKARWGVVGRRCKKQRATISTSSTTFFVGVPSIQASMVKVSHGSTGWRSSGPCGREHLGVGCLAAVVTANKARWDVVSRRCKRWRATLSTLLTKTFVSILSVHTSLVMVSYGATRWWSPGPCGREYLGVSHLAAVVTTNKGRWDVVGRRYKSRQVKLTAFSMKLGTSGLSVHTRLVIFPHRAAQWRSSGALL